RHVSPVCFGATAVIRPGGALLDPGAEGLDFRWRKRIAGWRHSFLRVAGGDLLEKEAFRCVSRHHGQGTGIASTQGVRPSIQAQAAALLSFVVTLEAVTGEDRFHIS